MSIYLGNTAIGNGNYLGNLNIRDSNIFMSASVNNNDPAAQAFITATGISGSNATAINQLVLDLKSNSLWTKMTAIYPLVGGTSSSTSYNLVDTTLYQITWNGGITFASTGITGNGTDGWGDTNLNPTTVGGYSSGGAISTYVRTAGNTNAYDMGGNLYPGTQPSAEWMLGRFGNDRITTFALVGPGNPYLTATTTDYTGFFVGTSNGTQRVYNDGTSLASNTAGYVVSNNTMGLCAQHRSNGVGDLSTREYAFFSLGQYLDATEVSNFSTCVNTFQTSLGRNV